MASSASRRLMPVRLHPETKKPIIIFVFGKYFVPNDYNRITEHVRIASKYAQELWDAGFLPVTPHLNTCHFEATTHIDADPMVSETFYRAYYHRQLHDAVDALRGIKENWRISSGSKVEITLGNELGKPAFEDLGPLIAWSEDGSTAFRLQYRTDEPFEMTKVPMEIALIDGPNRTIGEDFNESLGLEDLRRAQDAAISLWNNKVACFTPHMNAHYDYFKRTVPEDRYQMLSDEMLERHATCLLLLEGYWDSPRTRERIILANRMNKPVFPSVEDLLKWSRGKQGYSTIGS